MTAIYTAGDGKPFIVRETPEEVRDRADLYLDDDGTEGKTKFTTFHTEDGGPIYVNPAFIAVIV